MINDYEIVVGGFVTNISLTGYKPVICSAIESWAKPDFVDRIIIVDGKSIDDTTKVLNDINCSKLEVKTSSKQWPVDSWTWETLYDIENDLLKYVNSIENKQKILLTFSTDTVFTDSSIEEIKSCCTGLINDDNSDYVNSTFMKAITPDYMSAIYPRMQSWYINSITKFNNNINWIEIEKGECGVITNRPIRKYNFEFKSPPICYDLFCFTEDQIAKKLERHVDFHNKPKPSVNDYIIHTWLRKLNSYGIKKNVSGHSKEAMKFISSITDKNFGYNLFDNVKHVRISR